jgi:hypothetical protein
MSIVISILVVAGFSFLLWKLPFFRNTGLKPWHVLCAFYCKLLVAVVFYWVYTQYPAYKNQSDSRAFYHSAGQFAAIAHENWGDYLRASFHIPVQSPVIHETLQRIPYWNRPYDNSMPNDTRQTLILYSFIYLLSFGSLPIMLICANFLAFCGLFALFKTFLLARIKLLPAGIACFCIPATLFWSSGLLKEVWLLLFMGFTLYSAALYFKTKQPCFAIVTLIWAIALLHIKLYIALCLLPLIVIYGIRRKWHTSKAIVFYPCALAVCACIALLVGWCANFNIIETLVQQRNTFVRMLEARHHATILVDSFNGSFPDFIIQLFAGLGNVFLYPNVFDTQNIFVCAAGVENTLIAALVLCCIVLYAKKCVAISDYTIVMLVFIVAVYAIIGFTTPNMGALVRYKSPLLPFVIVVFCNYKTCVLRK